MFRAYTWQCMHEMRNFNPCFRCFIILASDPWVFEGMYAGFHADHVAEHFVETFGYWQNKWHRKHTTQPIWDENSFSIRGKNHSTLRLTRVYEGWDLKKTYCISQRCMDLLWNFVPPRNSMENMRFNQKSIWVLDSRCKANLNHFTST